MASPGFASPRFAAFLGSPGFAFARFAFFAFARLGFLRLAALGFAWLHAVFGLAGFAFARLVFFVLAWLGVLRFALGALRVVLGLGFALGVRPRLAVVLGFALLDARLLLGAGVGVERFLGFFEDSLLDFGQVRARLVGPVDLGVLAILYALDFSQLFQQAQVRLESSCDSR